MPDAPRQGRKIVTGPVVAGVDEDRQCEDCETRLSRYNLGRWCVIHERNHKPDRLSLGHRGAQREWGLEAACAKDRIAVGLECACGHHTSPNLR